jgi:hypothetical protein
MMYEQNMHSPHPEVHSEACPHSSSSVNAAACQPLHSNVVPAQHCCRAATAEADCWWAHHYSSGKVTAAGCSAAAGAAVWVDCCCSRLTGAVSSWGDSICTRLVLPHALDINNNPKAFACDEADDWSCIWHGRWQAAAAGGGASSHCAGATLRAGHLQWPCRQCGAAPKA